LSGEGDGPDAPTELDERLLRGLDLFDAGEHFEAHEVLEDLWAGEVGATRHLLQALIQLTVALHHRGNGNHGGTRTLLERALEHLAAVKAPTLCFVDVRRLEREVAALREEAAARAQGKEAAEPPFPSFAATRERIRAGRRAAGLPQI
jgi:predicted metal-dependent hydrolase